MRCVLRAQNLFAAYSRAPPRTPLRQLTALFQRAQNSAEFWAGREGKGKGGNGEGRAGATSWGCFLALKGGWIGRPCISLIDS